LGAIGNLPAFYKAFGIKAGDAMFAPTEARILVW